MLVLSESPRSPIYIWSLRCAYVVLGSAMLEGRSEVCLQRHESRYPPAPRSTYGHSWSSSDHVRRCDVPDSNKHALARRPETQPLRTTPIPSNDQQTSMNLLGPGSSHQSLSRATGRNLGRNLLYIAGCGHQTGVIPRQAVVHLSSS